jgi:hypothetical protein
MHSRRPTLIAVTALLSLGSMLMSFAPAHAAGPIECRLAATTTQSVLAPGTPATYQWNIIMIGVCSGDLKGQYSAFGSVDGTSLGLGLCDGSLLVQNLDLDAVMFLDSTRGPAFSKFLHEHWYAPVTTFPVVMPFLIENVAGPTPTLAGAGALFQHIGLNCSGANPSTLILNVRLA